MRAARFIRGGAEFLHLPAVAFTVLTAVAFVRVLGERDGERLVTFIVAVLLTQLSIAVHNNWCDRGADAVSKPWRWIPRGVIAPNSAVAAAVLLFASGITAGFALGPAVGGLVLLGTTAGLAYNAWLKKTPWSWVPFCVALPTLAICSLALTRGSAPLPLGLYAVGAPLVVAIHLADAVPDIAADRAAGVRGLAVTLGRRRALAACWALLAFGLGLAVLTWPPPSSPGSGALASAVLLVLGVAVSGRSLRAHWYLIFTSAVALAVDWVSGLRA
ncbi:hypothetical protein BH18CHL2_BH18CHL2_09070 [soil metagenome]